MSFIRHFLLAVQFFTRIPVTGQLAYWVGFSPAMLRASAAHFPGVGWLVAGVAIGVYSVLATALSATVFSPLVAAALSTVATLMLTGGFHEDGLADVADGLGGSTDRERALDIMKDSRIGAFGAMALTMSLLAKVALLAALGAQGIHAAVACLAAGHVLSRFLPLMLVRALPHVGDTDTSKSKPLADQISLQSLACAALWCVPALPLFIWLRGSTALALALAASGLAFLWMWRLFARRLQGFTGDCLGATQQVCEITFYLGAAVAAGLR
ncbi:adenosylcobinamide-GDP ribazoletransferase [soil metagenome]